MTADHNHIDYQQLISVIGEKMAKAQKSILAAVNTQMLITYWEIGMYIVDFEQGGKDKASYGKAL